jgi:hypothetical protein
LAAPVVDTLASATNPDSATKQEPQITTVGAWPVLARKAVLCSFPGATDPSWAFAYDNDGVALAQITYPAQTAGLPDYVAAAMPLAGDSIELYVTTGFAKLEDASINAIATHYGSPAVILETLRFTSCRFDGSILQSRCIWDSTDSSIETTGTISKIVCCAQEMTDGASYTMPRAGTFIYGSFFNFLSLVEGSAWLIDTQFNFLQSVQSVFNATSAILVQPISGGPAMYASYFSIMTVHGAFWGTPLSGVALYRDASLYILPAGSPSTFNPTACEVGVGGAALPALVGGAVVPVGASPITPAALAAAPFSGKAIEYTLNCRIVTG